MNIGEKYRFLIRNIIHGFIWLAVIVFLFIFLSNHFEELNFKEYLRPLYDQPLLMYVIFSGSELLFGVIPPELFMIWALDYNSIFIYTEIIVLLTVISYLAGFCGYVFGKYLSYTVLFRFLRKRYFKKYEAYLNLYGSFLIIVAALTPIPFSAVCMVVGSSRFPTYKFLLFSSFRIFRFAVYGFIIWQFQGI